MRLITVRELDEIERISTQLAPYYNASWQAYVDLSQVEGPQQAQALLARIDADVRVVPRVRAAVRHNVEALYDMGVDAALSKSVIVKAPEARVAPMAHNEIGGQLDASTAPVDYAILAPQDADDGNASHREVFTIGQQGVASPARLAELVARLGVVHVVDTRAPAPSHGPWSRAELAPLLGERLVLPTGDSDAGNLISLLPVGRVLVFGSAKRPGDAPGRLAIGEEQLQRERGTHLP